MNKFIIIFFIFFSSNAMAKGLCNKFSEKKESIDILKKLSVKLKYSYSELCSHDRILNIQEELRKFYYSDFNEYQQHNVITLHYSEYSCEYHYNKKRLYWVKDRQNCYNTF